MAKYIDKAKSDKARRKALVVVGNMPKRKAKAFCKKHTNVVFYGTYSDGTVDLGVSTVTSPVFRNHYAQRIVEAKTV